MQQTYQSAGIFTRRIGNTNYRVNVHYRPDNTDRMEDIVPDTYHTIFNVQ